MQRISVVAKNELVPLFSSDPVRDSRVCPWKGVLVEAHNTGPIEIPEHEHPSVFLRMQSSGPVEFEWQCDGKLGRKTLNTGSLILLSRGTRDRSTGLHQESWGFQDDQLRLLLSEIERELVANWSMGKLYGDILGMALALAAAKRYSNSNKVLQFAKRGSRKQSSIA